MKDLEVLIVLYGKRFIDLAAGGETYGNLIGSNSLIGMYGFEEKTKRKVEPLWAGDGVCQIIDLIKFFDKVDYIVFPKLIKQFYTKKEVVFTISDNDDNEDGYVCEMLINGKTTFIFQNTRM